MLRPNKILNKSENFFSSFIDYEYNSDFQLLSIIMIYDIYRMREKEHTHTESAFKFYPLIFSDFALY